MNKKSKILAVILAGGLSTRMGQDKSLLKIDGKTLLNIQIDRLKKENFSIAVSSNQLTEKILKEKISLFKDQQCHFYKGPLAGIYSGLEYAIEFGFSHILTFPIDCPILPKNFFYKMTENLTNSSDFRIVKTVRGLQPTFGLWPVTLKESLNQFLLTSQDKSIRSFAFAHNPQFIIFDKNIDKGAFFNINTHADLDKFKKIIKR
ncbi:molybdenum cofactor guanylyltransferase [Bartonella tamiae]|uniref:Molybdenum cofactor guanylyltransferase n=1 Tax=Bartonella tamiae Th239 TaxID=1094558 RepID=J1JUV0_9HYPH|nr:molybdenum cofactor guanylyltransferase [Bartonella tamiae]EJF88747.1 molybdopterin-guanine dinucleotide biosynthesis protein A [Bartonella tamiae Th239]EJF95003.1 molybdopterin-guanine dinucleotide biosynthesis protein A [Bartonella tamiae Th307]